MYAMGVKEQELPRLENDPFFSLPIYYSFAERASPKGGQLNRRASTKSYMRTPGKKEDIVFVPLRQQQASVGEKSAL